MWHAEFNAEVQEDDGIRCGTSVRCRMSTHAGCTACLVAGTVSRSGLDVEEDATLG